MSLTNAILTGFSGIKSNQVSVDTIGNNVANLNTTGFKSSRTLFETLYVQTIRGGTAPDENQGGTNPLQIGYGSGVATVQKNFNQGTTQQTGVVTDMAIEGNGFFVLNTPAQSQAFTRAGGFNLNTENLLTTPEGSFVQGFGASEDGTIDAGNLGDLEIPLGVTSDAAATTRAVMGGNLNAAGDVATSGSISESAPLTVSGGAAATAATALSALVDANGEPLFSNADVVRISNVTKGDIRVADADFVVGTNGTTLGDLASFVESALGIDTSGTAIGSPGVTIGDGTTSLAGAFVIRSNAGQANGLDFTGGSIRNSTNSATPFVFDTTAATGAGAATSFRVVDSLGSEVDVRLRLTLESKSNAGTTWRFTGESAGDTDPGSAIGGGTISFDTDGRFVEATGTDLSIARDATGAVTPLAFSVDFSALTGLSAEGRDSEFQMDTSDGFLIGTLTGFEVEPDGVITGTFNNGQDRVFGQIALATFANDQGLVAQSQNTYTIGVNSGEAMIAAPLAGAAGQINSRQLELGNVDLSRELIGLITASTGFSAASRTVRTADDMLQELMLLVR